MRKITFIILVGFLGCSNNEAELFNVEPWQKEILARDDMQLSYDDLDADLDKHIYFSREATSGGRSFAGAGCGCN